MASGAIDPQIVEQAVEFIQKTLDDEWNFGYDEADSLFQSAFDVCNAATASGNDVSAINRKLSDLLRKLLPVADVMQPLQQKIQDGSFLGLAGGENNEKAISDGADKLLPLLMMSGSLLHVASTLLRHMVNKNVQFSETRISRDDLLKAIKVANFPLELLTNDNYGLSALASRYLFVESTEGHETIFTFADRDFCWALNSLSRPLARILDIISIYEIMQSNPVLLAELRTLPLPPTFSDASVNKALIQLARLTNQVVEEPKYRQFKSKLVPHLHLKAYISFCVAEVPKAGAGSADFWRVLLQENLIAAPVFDFLVHWKEMRGYTDISAHSVGLTHKVETIILLLCRELIQKIKTTNPKESCKAAVEPFLPLNF